MGETTLDYDCLQKRCQDVDAEGDDGGIEDEGDHAMEKGQTTHGARAHAGIGRLASHANDEREVGEIQVVGAGSARELEAAAWFLGAGFRAIVEMRIPQSEEGMHEDPGLGDGEDALDEELEFRGLFDDVMLLLDGEEDGEHAHAGGHEDKREEEGSARILQGDEFRIAAGMAAQQHDPAERDEGGGKNRPCRDKM